MKQPAGWWIAVRSPLPLPNDDHMDMPFAETDWTSDMLDALPDHGQRYRISDGVLMCVAGMACARQP